MNLPLAPETEIPADTGCTKCGSSNLTTFEANSPTGVQAPDGGAESVWEEGVHCFACGADAAECESREWLAEAFQIVGGEAAEGSAGTPDCDHAAFSRTGERAIRRANTQGGELNMAYANGEGSRRWRAGGYQDVRPGIRR